MCFIFEWLASYLTSKSFVNEIRYIGILKRLCFFLFIISNDDLATQ